MNDQTLTKTMRARVATNIRELGFSVPDFEWRSQESQFLKATTVSRLVFLPNESFYFVFDQGQRGYESQYSPGLNDRTANASDHERNEQLNEVLLWLACLNLELETDDPWQDFVHSFMLNNGSGFAEIDTSPFTDEEKVTARDSLKSFEALLQSEFAPSEAKLEEIHERLAYLDNALERLNKFDWKSALFSTTVNIAVALTLSPDRAGILFNLLYKAFVQVRLLGPFQ